MEHLENSTFEPLKRGLPHIAYVLLWYPLFTQPFIFREVECLRKILPIKVYTLYGRNLRNCSREMKECACNASRLGLKEFLPVFGNLCGKSLINPKLVYKLFKRSMAHKWENMEVLGENLWAFCAGLTLGQKFREDGIDMVYAPWPRGAATAAWVASSLAGLPFAVAARGDNLNPADPDLGAKFSAAAFIRANNEADRQRIENFDKGQARGKTELLYNSLTLPHAVVAQRRRKPGDVLKLLALGRFDVTKGFDILLKSCAILKERGIRFKLTLAGSGGRVMGLGHMDKKLHELRKELGLMELVDMPGLVNHDDLPRLLGEHDLFVAPCVIHETGRRDGIPNTIIEAMAYGMPVVSTNINALPEIVRDGQTGLAVPPNEPLEFANAIIRLEQNPELARSLGENGARLARQLFDPSENAQILADIFRKNIQRAQCAE